MEKVSIKDAPEGHFVYEVHSAPKGNGVYSAFDWPDFILYMERKFGLKDNEYQTRAIRRTLKKNAGIMVTVIPTGFQPQERGY